MAFGLAMSITVVVALTISLLLLRWCFKFAEEVVMPMSCKPHEVATIRTDLQGPR